MAATIDGFFNTFNAKLDAPVRSHLKNVYASLTLALLSCTAGAYAHLHLQLAQSGLGLLGALAAVGLALSLHFTPDNGKNRGLRMSMLLGFALLTGLGLGPLLDMAIRINPAIILNALLLSTMIFACFSGAALFAPDGQYLYLGGSLMSGMSVLFWMGFLNIFFQSQLIFQVYLWGGLFLFCGFIVWDTQMIILKHRHGDKDFIKHSMELFIDFVQIFRKILILLMQKEENKDKRRRR